MVHPRFTHPEDVAADAADYRDRGMTSYPRVPITARWAADLVDSLDRAFQYVQCAVLVDDGSGQRLMIAEHRYAGGGSRPVADWSVPVDGSLVGRAFQTAQPALLPDVSLGPEHPTYPGAAGRSEMAAPVVVDGQVVGVASVLSGRVGAFGIADLDRLVELATDVARRAVPVEDATRSA